MSEKGQLVKRSKDLESKRKVSKRFKTILLVLFVLIPFTFLINKHFRYFEDVNLIIFYIIMVIMWFYLDYKIFNDNKRTLICVFLSLLNITFVLNTQDIFIAKIATFPLSLIVVIWTLNKYMGAKFDFLINEYEWIRPFIFVIFGIAALISILVFNPILNLFK